MVITKIYQPIKSQPAAVTLSLGRRSTQRTTTRRKMGRIITIILALALAATNVDAFISSSGNFLARSKAMRMQASSSSLKLPSSVKPGVVTGQAYRDLIQYAQDKGFAIPGVNTIGKRKNTLGEIHA
jgi:hypothetical protein